MIRISSGVKAHPALIIHCAIWLLSLLLPGGIAYPVLLPLTLRDSEAMIRPSFSAGTSAGSGIAAPNCIMSGLIISRMIFTTTLLEVISSGLIFPDGILGSLGSPSDR